MNEAFHTSLHTAMKARAAEILPEVIELRRTIHKHFQPNSERDSESLTLQEFTTLRKW